MPLTVQDTLNIIEKIAPASLAEEWDNVGLMIGDPSASVESILLGLDPTLQLLDEAIAIGANLLITHHPFIFHPLRSVHLGIPEGIFVERAIQNKINVISCHTNLDAATEGVSHSLASKLGLENIQPLEAHGENELCGMGCIGNYKNPLSPDEFITRFREACSPPWLLATQNQPETIDRVAVCGGSGSELAPKAFREGAQVYVTAEVKHAMARWAEETGLWIVDAGHFATENQALAVLAQHLGAASAEHSPDLQIRVTVEQDAPLQIIGQ